jgi:tRNA nucleotidyltransferase (CCA-adding enzyme)
MREALRRLRLAIGAGELVLVGGAVRDELLGRPHSDWDLATNLFPDVVLRRAKEAGLRAIPTGLQHGTVTVMVDQVGFEITTYRADGDYSDGRRPDDVRLGVSLTEDLARRDFTINAMALPVTAEGDLADVAQIVDPFQGRSDLARQCIRAVGNPLDRFMEDGLRPLRACRFAAQLGFSLDPDTADAIPPRLAVAAKVASERAFTELTKLICGPYAAMGMRLLESTGLLDLWLPELRAMVGCGQNHYHRYDVWHHTLRALDAAQAADPAMRWALLLHDVAKPPTRTVGEDGEAHFYGHEDRSIAMAEAVLRRLKASNQLIEEVTGLIRHHGVHPNEEWSNAACRRFLRRLEEDGLTLERWTQFRIADQLAKGWGDAPQIEGRTPMSAVQPSIFEACAATQGRLQALLDAKPPLSARDLALNGRGLMALLGRPGGPWLGDLQRYLLEQVLDDPALNSHESLVSLVKKWADMEQSRIH